MSKKYVQTEAMLSILGGNYYPRGTKMARLIFDDGRQFRVEVLGEHDGKFIMDQVGGVIVDTDFLVKNSRGSREGRATLKGGMR